jgi:hypothetical protein
MAATRREIIVGRVAGVLVFVFGSGLLALNVAEAQPQGQAQASGGTFTGFATGSIGLALGGDVADPGWTPGGSIAIYDPSGWGAELDLSHVRAFDQARFLESGVTSLMLNVTGIFRDEVALVRPYALGGVGLLRARACAVGCLTAVSRTGLGFDAGGGVFVLFNEAFGARGDVRYFRYLQRDADLPLTDNGLFDFWRVSIGASISWPIR